MVPASWAPAFSTWGGTLRSTFTVPAPKNCFTLENSDMGSVLLSVPRQMTKGPGESRATTWNRGRLRDEMFENPHRRRPMRTASFALMTTFALSLAGALGCSPSPKNEEQYWTVHQTEISEYGGRWPGFKGLLAARLEKARPAWEAALAIGNDKEKAQKMHDANALLADGLLARLGEVKYKSKGIDETIEKINGLRLPTSRAGERQEAVASAQKSVNDVERAMVAAR